MALHRPADTKGKPGKLPRTLARPRERPTFTAHDRTSVKDVGILVSVDLDRDTEDFAHLVGKRIIINGRLETCFSVERFNHLPPWKAGERISLLIRKAKPGLLMRKR
jgi:hypothetical protein